MGCAGRTSDRRFNVGRNLGLPPGGSPDSPSQLRVCALLFPFQALQIGHAPKLSEIGGHEGRPKSESMGRDEHVERTDDDASLLQINAQVTVVARGLSIPSQHLKDFGEGIYSLSLRSRTDGTANPNFELRNGDRGE